MKKILIGLILTLCLVAVAGATISATISQAVTSAGYSAVRLPAGLGCQAFALWSEDGSGFYIASTSDGSDGVLLPEGRSIAMKHRFYGSDAGTIICYVKGTASTNIVGLVAH